MNQGAKKYSLVAYLKELSFKDILQITHIALVEKLPNRDIEYKRFYFKK